MTQRAADELLALKEGAVGHHWRRALASTTITVEAAGRPLPKTQ